MIDLILKNFPIFFPEINKMFEVGFLVFIRLLGFVRFSPVFNRKETPGMIKLAFVLIFSVLLTMILDLKQFQGDGSSLLLGIILNFTFGALLGWIANCIFLAVEAGGDMINMQMGLSSAQMLDPTTQGMTSLMGRLFSLIALVIFFNIGGIYWLLNAFIRSFEIFSPYAHALPLTEVFNLEYVTVVSANLLFIGLQIASPVLLATMGQDIILGVISKTAPQINVFQLSFLFKPVFGAAILIWIMPMLINVINDYFLSYSRIF